MRAVLVLVMLAALAATGHAEEPRLISKSGGAGDLPEDSDVVTYHTVQWHTGGDRKDAIEDDERTDPVSEIQPWFGGQLRAMRPGERRRLRYFGTHGNECDHFGCAPPSSWDIDLVLVSVTSHHDVLPDDLHIDLQIGGALHVRRGKVSALLPVPLADRLDEVRLRGDTAVLAFTADPFWAPRARSTLEITLAQLYARLADAEAADAIRAHRWDAALASADRAIELDPAFDGARLSRAWALVGRGKLDDAVAAVAPVIERNPVWLYWRLVATPALARLLAHPTIARLAAATPGTAGQDDWLLVEPSGRFLAYRSQPGAFDGMRTLCGIVVVVDRKTFEVAARIPAGACKEKEHAGERPIADRVLKVLGFTPVEGERAEVTLSGGPYAWRFADQRVVFPVAGVTLVGADHPADRAHVPIEMPEQAAIVDAQLLGDVVVYRWHGSNPYIGAGAALRVAAGAGAGARTGSGSGSGATSGSASASGAVNAARSNTPPPLQPRRSAPAGSTPSTSSLRSLLFLLAGVLIASQIWRRWSRARAS